MTGLASVPRRDAQRLGRAQRGFLERQAQRVAQVGAAVDLLGAAATAAGAAEDFLEDAAEVAETGATAAEAAETRAGCRRIDASMPVAVVGGALLRVAQRLVGQLGLLELLLAVLVTLGAVGMVFHGQLAVGLLQGVVVGIAGDAQNFVEIALGHAARRR
ncbi:hypothetical protein GALL_369410 [mine drainage metagenome]|uniref:Uncharacterized protein n=1 Tax=mine drainage metagenome TaxID=410659 RepID=A0A1J5QCB0_9ZZZZ